MSDLSATIPVRAGLLKRLAAMVYDLLLITALWMMVGGLLVFLNGNQVINSPLLPLLLPLVVAGFYSYFWLKTGQTLGMQTWRIKLVSANGQPLTVKQCVTRLLAATFSMACFGLGYLWQLVDRESLSWHDRWSKTRIILVLKT